MPSTSQTFEPTEYQYPETAAAAQAMADAVARQLAGGLLLRGRASLLVSGGRSPVPFFQALRDKPLDWSRICVGLVDERWVEPGSEDSNEHLVRTHLLQGAAAAATFIGLKTAAASPAAALQERTVAMSGLPQPFDVVVLGMGEDGHTASLFPGAAGLGAALAPDGPALLAAIHPPQAPYERLSLTVRALRHARYYCLMLQGPTKRAVYQSARAGAELPIASLLNSAPAPFEVFLVEA